DDGRQAALHAARADEPARDSAREEPEDDPADDVPTRHGRIMPPTTLRGLDVLVQMEQVGRVVRALDLGQPVVGLARVDRLADPRLALVTDEVDVGAGVRLPD